MESAESATGDTEKRWHILLVEDDPDDAELIRLALGDAEFSASFTRVETASEMQAALDHSTVDAIISDYSIPGFGGRQALEIMQRRGLDMPFIIVSGEIGENTAVALMKAGVHDYISKRNLTRLAPAIERELRDCGIRHARRKTEQSLRESEQRYAALIQSIHGIVWEAKNLPGVYTFASARAETILGFPLRRWCDEDTFWLNNIHPEDRTWVIQEYARHIAQEKPFQLEYRRTNYSGETIWIRDVVTPGPPDADIPMLRGITFNVTEQREAEEERERLLRITEQRAKEMSTIAAVSAALRTATSHHDTLAIVTTSLQSLLPLHALAYHPMVQGRLGPPVHVTGSWPPGALERVTANAGIASQINSAFEAMEIPGFGDNATHFEGQLVAMPLRTQGRLLGVLWAHYRDDIEGGNANRPLSASEKRLFTALADIIAGAIYRAELYEEITVLARQMQETMAATPQGLVLLGSDRRIILVNPAGRAALACLAPNNGSGPLTHLGETDLILPSGTDMHLEVTCHSPSSRTFEILIRPLAPEFAQHSWLLSLVDVTEERLEQRRLQEQNRLAAVGQLAAGIAHDFNNSLGVIRLYTELVRRHADLSERDQTRLQTVADQIGHASHLIHQILDFSRRSIMQRKSLDLVQGLADILSVLEHTLGKNIEIVYTHPPGPMWVEVDPSRLQQAILNLAVNARDAMPQGGTLTFDLHHTQFETPRDAPEPDMVPGDWAQLTVTDTGHGIEAEHLSQLFEPFFTTKPAGHGTGLGLAQVYGIVKQHNGYIYAQSDVGKGTRFDIFLPIQRSAAEIETPRVQVAHDVTDHHILVVEDDPAGRAALKAMLLDYGYRVTTAENGEDALHQIEMRKTDSDSLPAPSFDLIITDLVMPRMSGIQLYHQLVARAIAIPTIVITGYPLADGGQELLEAGIVDWISKPFEMEQLLEKIAAVLGAASEVSPLEE